MGQILILKSLEWSLFEGEYSKSESNSEIYKFRSVLFESEALKK